MRALIRENHRLLVQIGVVPEKVQRFISAVEARGGAAKICGAGAISGNAGGTLLLLAEELPQGLCEQYGYAADPVRGDPLGTRMV
jgi:mevalonate kinase